MTDDTHIVPGQTIRLSTRINQLVRFKLHELADVKEGVSVPSTSTATGLKAVRLPNIYAGHRRVLTPTPKFNSLNSGAFTGRKGREKVSTVVISPYRK